jgi:hypothetical protein
LVPLNDLVLLPELSPREKLHEETVIRYMDTFISLPPVRVQRGTRVVVDGYHRVEAATRLGLEAIPAEETEIDDGELGLVAGVSNAAHGHPLTRSERNRLAVALVQRHGRVREEVARLMGMSTHALTLALREQQLNDLLSEKLGAPVQVINATHVRALYRVGQEQRERLLEVVVGKVDDDGRPYPLTGAELKLLVDRMLDPATPAAELSRLMNDPKARPRPATPSEGPASVGSAGGDPFLPEPGNTRPWEREWESPLKGGNSDAFEGVRAVDEEIGGARSSRPSPSEGEFVQERTLTPSTPFWGSANAPHPEQSEQTWKSSVWAAATALADLIPQVGPEPVRTQLSAVLALLQHILE